MSLIDRHPFNDGFSRTTSESQHQKDYTNLDFNEARDDNVAMASAGPYANYLHSLQTGNHASTSSLNFYRPDALLDAQPTASNTEGKQYDFNNFSNLKTMT